MQTIYIMDEIGEEGSLGVDAWGWPIPTVSAKSVINQLSWYGKDEPVEVLIHSKGGNVLEGLAIYGAIKARGNVTTKVCGVAASIASVIFCAGQERVMLEGSHIMIHNPVTGAYGGHETLTRAASLAKGMGQDLAQIYADAAGNGKTAEEFLALMAEETWLNADDAQALGLSTATASCESPDELKAMAAKDCVSFHNIPKEVLMHMKNQGHQGPAGGAPSALTMAQVVARINDLKAIAPEGFDVLALVGEGLPPDQESMRINAALRDENAKLKAQLQDAEQKLAAAPAAAPALTAEELAAQEAAAAEKAATEKSEAEKAAQAKVLAGIRNAGGHSVPVAGGVDHREIMNQIKDPVERTIYWREHIAPTMQNNFTNTTTKG